MSTDPYRPPSADGGLSIVEADVRQARVDLHALHGSQNHPDGTGGPAMAKVATVFRRTFLDLVTRGGPDWRSILLAKVHDAMTIDTSDPAGEARLRAELVGIAATVQTWAGAIDRRKARRAARAHAAGRS